MLRFYDADQVRFLGNNCLVLAIYLIVWVLTHRRLSVTHTSIYKLPFQIVTHGRCRVYFSKARSVLAYDTQTHRLHVWPSHKD